MDLNELRAEVARRQKAATAKIARLRRKGVQIGGTDFDIRRDRSNIAKYNSRQLNSYLGELNSFTNRNTAFVPGVEGTPLRAQKWRAYLREQKAYLAKAQGHYDSVSETFIESSNMTVAQFDDKVRSNRPGAKGGVVRPLEMISRDSTEIVDAKKLDALRRQLARKNKDNYLPGQLKKQRARMMETIGVYGDEEMLVQAKALTTDQFDTMWNYTDAPRDLFGGYHFIKLLAANQADGAAANIHDDDKLETKKWLEWAGSLPARNNRKNRR